MFFKTYFVFFFKANRIRSEFKIKKLCISIAKKKKKYLFSKMHRKTHIHIITFSWYTTYPYFTLTHRPSAGIICLQSTSTYRVYIIIIVIIMNITGVWVRTAKPFFHIPLFYNVITHKTQYYVLTEFTTLMNTNAFFLARRVKKKCLRYTVC